MHSGLLFFALLGFFLALASTELNNGDNDEHDKCCGVCTEIKENKTTMEDYKYSFYPCGHGHIYCLRCTLATAESQHARCPSCRGALRYIADDEMNMTRIAQEQLNPVVQHLPFSRFDLLNAVYDTLLSLPQTTESGIMRLRGSFFTTIDTNFRPRAPGIQEELSALKRGFVHYQFAENTTLKWLTISPRKMGADRSMSSQYHTTVYAMNSEKTAKVVYREIRNRFQYPENLAWPANFSTWEMPDLVVDDSPIPSSSLYHPHEVVSKVIESLISAEPIYFEEGISTMILILSISAPWIWSIGPSWTDAGWNELTENPVEILGQLYRFVVGENKLKYTQHNGQIRRWFISVKALSQTTTYPSHIETQIFAIDEAMNATRIVNRKGFRINYSDADFFWPRSDFAGATLDLDPELEEYGAPVPIPFSWSEELHRLLLNFVNQPVSGEGVLQLNDGELAELSERTLDFGLLQKIQAMRGGRTEMLYKTNRGVLNRWLIIARRTSEDLFNIQRIAISPSGVLVRIYRRHNLDEIPRVTLDTAISWPFDDADKLTGEYQPNAVYPYVLHQFKYERIVPFSIVRSERLSSMFAGFAQQHVRGEGVVQMLPVHLEIFKQLQDPAIDREVDAFLNGSVYLKYQDLEDAGYGFISRRWLICIRKLENERGYLKQVVAASVTHLNPQVLVKQERVEEGSMSLQEILRTEYPMPFARRGDVRSEYDPNPLIRMVASSFSAVQRIVMRRYEYED